MLDPDEFLGPYGIRSLSRYHADAPFDLAIDGQRYTVGYEPAESRSGLFGGNSNWRGPVWFPLNYLLIEALRTFHSYYGDGFLVEHPTGSGIRLPLDRVANDLADASRGHLPSGCRMDVDPCSETTSRHDPTQVGVTSCCSTSTSMATLAPAWVPVIRPAGPPSSLH